MSDTDILLNILNMPTEEKETLVMALAFTVGVSDGTQKAVTGIVSIDETSDEKLDAIYDRMYQASLKTALFSPAIRQFNGTHHMDTYPTCDVFTAMYVTAFHIALTAAQEVDCGDLL